MQFAPIEAIKDLLTGNIWDKFKEMIEPYALINAIIFLALNLALVFPALGGLAANPFIAALATASDVWKLAASTIVLFIFSYLINHLNGLSINFASGELFRKFPIISGLLKLFQTLRYKNLETISRSLNNVGNKDIKESDIAKRDTTTFKLAYEFSVMESEIGLTRLGDLLLCTPSYVSHQYGASMQLVWPILRDKLQDDDKTVKSIQSNWTALQFFTSLYGILILLVVEILMVAVLGGKAANPWHLVGLLFFAGISYYASLGEARAWDSEVRHIFDSHIPEFFSDFRMDGLQDLNPASSDFKSNWKDVLCWLAYGAIRPDIFKPKPAWYKTETALKPDQTQTVKTPEKINVTTLSTSVNWEESTSKDGQEFTFYERLRIISLPSQIPARVRIRCWLKMPFCTSRIKRSIHQNR
jgi:hypothetical protein